MAARVLIIDDHELFSSALAATLRRADPATEVVCVTQGTTGIEQASTSSFDLVLCDLDMPGISGMEVLRSLKRIDPAARVCMLSANTKRAPMVEAISEGACGYLAKTIDLDEFVSKVNLALDGNQVYDETSATTIIAGFKEQADEVSLTPRELEVLVLLAQGFTNEEIGEKLFISKHTVRDFLRGIYSKLDCSDRAAAVATGFRIGLLS